jgi:DNA-binding transcriptional ArsR family regulator
MVNHDAHLDAADRVAHAGLDAVFAALAHPTRRAIAARLARGSATVGEVAAPFDVSAPAISRHLRTLEASGLVVRRREGRHHLLALDAARLDAAQRWLAETRAFYDERLDVLARHLKEHP